MVCKAITITGSIEGASKPQSSNILPGLVAVAVTQHFIATCVRRLTETANEANFPNDERCSTCPLAFAVAVDAKVELFVVTNLVLTQHAANSHASCAALR